MKLTTILRVLSSALLLLAATASAQPAAFSLLSPSNNDTIRSKTVYYYCQSSTGAHHYEVWVDNVKRGEVTADAKTPTQVYFDSVALATGRHSWYFVAVNAAGQRTQSASTFQFTLLSHPDLPYWAIGPFQKYGPNPILSPQGSGTGWESKNVLNPGVMVDDTGCFQMVYRAQDQTNNYSQIGYAHGVDGVTFSRNANPVIRNNGTGETYGCEDPRLVKLGNTYYCYYCAYNGAVSICVATSTDMINWTKYGPKLNNTKNPCIVINSNGTPALINGKYWMYHGDQGFTANTMRLVSSTDLINWTDAGVVRFRLDGMQWEPCIAIADASPNSDDIVVFFAGKLWGDTWFNPSNPLWYYYAISEVVFPKSNMLERIEKLDGMIMLPGKAYETNGQFNLCIFTNSVMKYRRAWWNHYGAGDSRVAVAMAPERNVILGPNRAKGKTVTASSSVQAGANAVDSSCATRWESSASDNQWIMVDLGALYDIRRVILKWEVAYGRSYRIQVSNDASTWNDAYTTTTGNGDFDDIVLSSPSRGRYVRMLATQRGTTYGYSLWEFEVFGTVPVNTVARVRNVRSGNNLFVNAGFISYSLVRARTVTLTVYSAKGETVARMTRLAQPGKNTISDWSAYNRLPAGTYCVALSMRGQASVTARTVKGR